MTFGLTTPGSAPLSLSWQYWNGTVWRDFASTLTACLGSGGQLLDSTAGLTTNGTFILKTDCAETAPTAINGLMSSWVRGQLTQPLPPNPAQILPVVGSITMRTQIARPLTFTASIPKKQSRLTDYQLTVRIQDAGGAPLPFQALAAGGAAGIEVSGTPALRPLGVTGGAASALTYSMTYSLGTNFTGTTQSVVVEAGTVNGSSDITIPSTPVGISQTFTLSGFRLDKAFADTTSIDLTKTYYPFGIQASAGAAFYVKSEEAFSKPGAAVQMLVIRSQTPQDLAWLNFQTANPTSTPIAHHVIWEYWDSRQWSILFEEDDSSGTPSGDLNQTEILSFTVPDDIAQTTVNGDKGTYIRARLISGGFGYNVSITSTTPNLTVTFNTPPALGDIRVGYTWQDGPYPPEHTLALNDFQFVDETETVLWPGNSFAPFQTPSDQTPALYLGFTSALPVDNDGINFAIEEQASAEQGPTLVWEYWNGFEWTEVDVTDQTQALGISGLISLIGPNDSQSLARFGTALYWLRGRLKEDGPPPTPIIDSIAPNAAWVVQRQTIVNEAMGASTGLPNQIFAFRRIPVLAGEYIQVLESVAPRAEIEWRLIAKDVFGGNVALMNALEAMLAAEGPQTSITQGDIELTRDKNKQVTEVWVHWNNVPTLFLSGPNDRVYTLDRASGPLQFGGGLQGKIPPPGASILAMQYLTGGGSAGNVAANTVTSLQGAIGKLEGVTNSAPAQGGTDGETFASLLDRGPQALRTRGRALAPADYETLARQAAPDLAVAHVLPATDPAGNLSPGWVTLIIIPDSDDPQPSPSFGLRENVRNYLETLASGDVATAAQLNVTGPVYQPIDVSATLVPIDPTQAGDVLIAARAALTQFLHPLLGGPAGQGWPPNRAVYLSDIAVALRGVAGLDYVQDLALLLNGISQGGSVAVTRGRIVAAGSLQLKVVEADGS